MLAFQEKGMCVFWVSIRSTIRMAVQTQEEGECRRALETLQLGSVMVSIQQLQWEEEAEKKEEEEEKEKEQDRRRRWQKTRSNGAEVSRRKSTGSGRHCGRAALEEMHFKNTLATVQLETVSSDLGLNASAFHWNQVTCPLSALKPAYYKGSH